jgi:hypothetical protein
MPHMARTDGIKHFMIGVSSKAAGLVALVAVAATGCSAGSPSSTPSTSTAPVEAQQVPTTATTTATATKPAATTTEPATSQTSSRPAARWSKTDIDLYRKALTSENMMTARSADCVIQRLQAAGLSADEVINVNPTTQSALAKTIEKIALTCVSKPPTP